MLCIVHELILDTGMAEKCLYERRVDKPKR